MATTYTPNYNLGKQEDLSDLFDMSVITDDMDKIDTALHNIQTSVPTVDSSLSTESENPVQNKVITTPLNAVTNKVQGINSTTNNSIVMGNNVTVYYTDTAPTGDIAEGSIGIGF